MTTKRKTLAITSILGLGLAMLTCSSACWCSSAGAQAQSSCTLPTQSRATREAQYRSMLQDHDATLASVSVRMHLQGETAVLRRQIESIAAAESECCTFMTMRFEPTPTGGTVEVSATGDGARLLVPMIEALR